MYNIGSCCKERCVEQVSVCTNFIAVVKDMP